MPVAARRYLEEAADIQARPVPARLLPGAGGPPLAGQDGAGARAPAVAGLTCWPARRRATDWFCDRVSFRLGYTARRLLALAIGGLGRTDEAAAALLADRERLADRPLCTAWIRSWRTSTGASGEVALLGR